jgi:uncharacterized membrane protein
MFEAVALMMFLILLVLFIVIASRAGTTERKLTAMERQVGAMQSDLRVLERELTALIASGARANMRADETERAVQPATVTQPVTIAQETPAREIEIGSPATPPEPVPPAKVVPAADRVPKPAPRSKQEWEMLIGGKLYNRIGAFALIIGVGLFFKYAVDKNWINETLRVCIGGTFGFALLGLGMWFEKRKAQIFAQGLIGAGVGILYLSAYATFNFYHLVPQIAAFALMSVVTAITLFLAIRTDSLAVSLLGWAGGFLTPLMLSTGDSNEIELFTYLALLDAGLLLIVIQKEKWLILQPLTLIATYVLYTAWFASSYDASQFAVTLVFLTLFWLLFYLCEWSRLVRPLSRYMELHEFIAVVNMLCFTASLHAVLEPAHHAFTAPALLAVGAVYFATWYATLRGTALPSYARARLLLGAVLMLVWSTGVQFDGHVLAIVWAVEAAVLAWAAVRWDNEPVVWAGVAVHVLALLQLLGTAGTFGDADPAVHAFLLNIRAAAFAAVGLALGWSGVLAERANGARNRLPAGVYHYTWIVVLLLFTSTETDHLFRLWMQHALPEDAHHLQFLGLMSVAGIWGLCALVLVWLGIRGRRSPLRFAGLGIAALAILVGVFRGAWYAPSSLFVPVLNMRAVILVELLVVLMLLYRLFAGDTNTVKLRFPLLNVLRVSGVVLLLVLLSGESCDSFLKAVDSLQRAGGNAAGAISSLLNMMQLTLSGIWLVFAVGLMIVGVRLRNRILRVLAILLSAVSILKIFLYDLSYLDTLYRIFSFVALGFILLIVSYLYQRFKDIIFADETPAPATPPTAEQESAPQA